MKFYNNEKGIISLTSWKARINTVHITIENILEKCPNWHIVLVLSEDEFPQKEEELPQNLKALFDKIEILWVKKNWKAFKKVAFTLRKYPTVPSSASRHSCPLCSLPLPLLSQGLWTWCQTLWWGGGRTALTQGGGGAFLLLPGVRFLWL